MHDVLRSERHKRCEADRHKETAHQMQVNANRDGSVESLYLILRHYHQLNVVLTAVLDDELGVSIEFFKRVRHQHDGYPGITEVLTVLNEVSQLLFRFFTRLLEIVRDLGCVVLVLVLGHLPLGNVAGDIEQVLIEKLLGCRRIHDLDINGKAGSLRQVQCVVQNGIGNSTVIILEEQGSDIFLAELEIVGIDLDGIRTDVVLEVVEVESLVRIEGVEVLLTVSVNVVKDTHSVHGRKRCQVRADLGKDDSGGLLHLLELHSGIDIVASRNA